MPSSYTKSPETGFYFVSTLHHGTYPEIDPSTKSNCAGKTILITEASRGVGRATAIAFALAGASQLAVAGKTNLCSLEVEIKDRCTQYDIPVPKLLTLSMDVRDEKSVGAAAEEVEVNFGRLDILYNNTEYMEDCAPIADSDPLEWWRTWETNVRGVYLCTRAFLPLMLKGGDKTIVNATSIGAHFLKAGASGYKISKLAIIRFSEYVNVEYADRGILCFSVHPGGAATDLENRMPSMVKGLLGDTTELAANALVYLTQAKREWLAGRYVSLTWDMPEFLSKEGEIIEGDKLKMRLTV